MRPHHKNSPKPDDRSLRLTEDGKTIFYHADITSQEGFAAFLAFMEPRCIEELMQKHGIDRATAKEQLHDTLRELATSLCSS